MLRWILKVLEKLLERISKFQPNKLEVIINWRCINHGSMKDAQNY
jgi:hypothetical protein